MTEKEVENYIDLLKKVVLEYSPKIIVALAILFIGLWITSILTKLVKKVLKKREVEEP